ncbi:MAG: ABC transporter ATP-binding protein [Actinomycetota bacterium]|nr:ABC transporter ATP-binding protein [Actinomycetota bacterium]
MRPVVIDVDHLSKRYYLGEDRAGGTVREALTGLARQLVGRGGHRTREEIWSLRDVSFDLVEGAALGVIGRNGAGKTTLLKILSRITEPTSGVARTRGRVAALLEVGTGFHPELTGRENVFLNGAILGMGRREIARRFDDIVTFAGVERFVDTPVKRYSSGMYLRLAFSVAAHLEPDILVVDEVLAVGDAEFQAKCLGRMASAEREGRTVVFVSHNLDAIVQLCPRAIWLEEGRIAADGAATDVVDAYLASEIRRSQSGQLVQDDHGRVTLCSVTVTDPGGGPVTVARRDRPLTIDVRFDVKERLPGLDLSIQLTNQRGVEVVNEAWSDAVANRPAMPGRYRARLVIPPVLNVGEYVIGVWIGTVFDDCLHERQAARIRLEGDPKGRSQRAVDLQLPWEVEILEADDSGGPTVAGAASSRADPRQD